MSESTSIKTHSSIWEHFTIIENGQRAECNYCGMKYKRTGGNTTNLHGHVNKKHSNKVSVEEVNGDIDRFVKKDVPRFTAGHFREFLIQWIVCDDQSFLAIENEHLRRLFRLLNPNVKSLSADTIHNDIIKLFKEEKIKIQEILQNAPGRLSFTLDAWTSPNFLPFLGITIHWITEDWELKETLIDFRKLSGPHSGENLHESFERCCSDMRILTKIMACTTDNATNNDTFVSMLQKTCKDRGIDFTAHNNHVRCLAHVINLAAQAALSKLKVSYVDNESEILNNNGEINDIIPKLRKLVVKIRSSPQKRENFTRQCEIANLPKKELILDVRTRWNSTYNMIERGCELREAISNIVIADRDLRRWELVESEWDLLNQIKSFLLIFSRATLHISHSQFPTIENSIPVYNWLMDKIEDFQKDQNLNETIKIAANHAMDKLKKYYKRTSALVYTVSTILDPRLKLTYHRDNNWEERYINEARKTITDLYDSQYAPVTNEVVEENPPEDELFCHIYKKRRLSNENELDLYLGTPIVSGKINLLQWWKLNETQFPNLAAMARDFLAIPATSVPVERAFSGGTELISTKRCNLSAETIQACMCLKSWWKLQKFE